MSDANREGLCDAVLPDLAELCRNHDVSLEMIRRSHDLDELLDGVLAEYESRLATVSIESTEADGRKVGDADANKLRALVMFAGQAAALKEKAVAATELRRRAEQLERANARLQEALNREERSRRRLDDVLAALDAGILITGSDGTIENANRAASTLTGVPGEELVGAAAQPFLGQVGRNQDGEIRRDAPDDPGRVLLVARRDLPSEPQSEAVLLSDVTERDRAIDERPRMDKLAEVTKTLSVLSHKINNPLTALVGRAQMLRMHPGTEPRVLKSAEVIEDASRRIAGYIRELALVVKEGRTEALSRVLDEDSAPPELGGTRR